MEKERKREDGGMERGMRSGLCTQQLQNSIDCGVAIEFGYDDDFGFGYHEHQNHSPP